MSTTNHLTRSYVIKKELETPRDELLLKTGFRSVGALMTALCLDVPAAVAVLKPFADRAAVERNTARDQGTSKAAVGRRVQALLASKTPEQVQAFLTQLEG